MNKIRKRFFFRKGTTVMKQIYVTCIKQKTISTFDCFS